MIELNLLPDIKLEYIKAQRTRRRVTAISILVTGASLVLLILLIGVGAVQKKHLNDLNKDISSAQSALKNEQDIDKILTVQNAIGSLNDLHAKKPAMARTFDYLNQVTPNDVSISDLSIDTLTQTVTISGSTNALSSVNKYVDTLKFTSFTESGSEVASPAFSNVVLTEFGLNAESTSADKAASYTVTFQYNPLIFDNAKDIKLTVPSLTTTRATVAAPTDLFQAAPPANGTGGNQ